MEIQIKKFHQLSLDQLYQILKLRMDAFVVEQNCPYPELDNLDQRATHYFIEKEEMVIGYLRVFEKEERVAKISRVVCTKQERGQGLSRELVKSALVELKSNSYFQSIILQSQEYLTDFYASFGFQKTSEVYLEDDIPHVDMKLSL
ncbi:GNAT family N-acetyltransferase [Reichenbachiella sp.]|uniref:GNAT family N-acetyltransferase n=1 Tax=Reichenbachiella sp. TaxID=2184521 RepID=UPI003BB09BB1